MRTVKLLAMLRSVAGAKELNVPFEDGGTVSDLIQAIGEVCPELKARIINEDGQLSGFAQIMVNGRHVTWLEGLNTKIGANDELCLLPMVGGG